MTVRLIKRDLLTLVLTLVGTTVFAQDNVSPGINYQAVARDNFGIEYADKRINVRFSIIAGDPLSTPVYQEVYQNVMTTRYGVFSLVIGHGVSTGSYKCKSLSEIAWQTAPHSLKVEVQFEGDNDFTDMGTMQFFAVPYALYAQKSLEPGPPGPQGAPGLQGATGPQGDPASDHQNLSVVNIDGSDYLAISGGNQVKVSSIEKDGDPTNEIQDIIINANKLKITKNTNATEWDLSKYLDNTDNQGLTWNSVTSILGISGNTGTIDLSELKNDADSDPTNEIQDLQISGDKLSITGKTGATQINLAPYRDNTDNQTLSYSESDNKLTIAGGNTVQIGSLVAFRAKKLSSETIGTFMTDYDFIASSEDYDDGGNYNTSTGVFSAPADGIYTFNVGYTATGTGDSRVLKICVNGSLYEILNGGITSGLTLTRSITMKLTAGDKVKPIINVGTGFETGTGSFSGFKVY